MAEYPLIYAHRGLWSILDYQNSIGSIERAKKLGFGVETDFRSMNHELVISHDPLTDSDLNKASDFDFSEIPVAMNIKEDGLSEQYLTFLERYPNENSFLFDGSIPEMRKIKANGLPHALRLSEYEENLPWETRIIWVDGFHSDWWINSKSVHGLLDDHFLIFVSPELHGRKNDFAWEFFRNLMNQDKYQFGVCSDFSINLRKFLRE